MIINFKLFEQINYDEYTEELTKDEFVNLVNEKCDISYFNNPFLIRFIKRDSKYLLINTEKHNLVIRDNNKLLFWIYDSWSEYGFPKKSKSLDFFHRNHPDTKLAELVSTEYYLIPFNRAKFAIKNQLIGRWWENLNNTPPSFSLKLTSLYKLLTDKDFDYDGDMKSQLYELGESIEANKKNPTVKEIWSRTHSWLNTIYDSYSIKNGLNFFDSLIRLFNPSRNEIYLNDLNGLKNYHKTYVGWTDSKVLMIRKDIYEKEFRK